jgi:hypothetical protein
MLRNDYGVYNALNLDGGGSATMALQDPVTHVRSVINTPTSGSRVVASSLVVFADPEITVEQPPGTNLIDGTSSIDCGSFNLGSSSEAFTVTVKNTGADDLTGLAVTKTGTNAGEFTVSAPGVTTLAPDTSTTFTVTFTPGADGPRTAAIRIASNDADENPFDINLTGTGVATAIQTWRQTYFGSIDNSGDGADLNDFDKDGLANILEFAFGLNPKQNSAGLLPQPVVAGNQLSLTFYAGSAGVTYTVESSTNLQDWDTEGVLVSAPDANGFCTANVPMTDPRRFLRLAVSQSAVPPIANDFALIPAGEFLVGDQSSPLVGEISELPVHTVQVSAFYMAKYEVTKALWDEIRAWGLTHNYTDELDSVMGFRLARSSVP